MQPSLEQQLLTLLEHAEPSIAAAGELDAGSINLRVSLVRPDVDDLNRIFTKLLSHVCHNRLIAKVMQGDDNPTLPVDGVGKNACDAAIDETATPEAELGGLLATANQPLHPVQKRVRFLTLAG